MAQLPLDQAITRFQSNENRLDTFANGGVADGYVSTAGIPVPSIQKFLAAKDTQINVGASSVLALATAKAEDAEDSAIAASASAIAAAGSASGAAGAATTAVNAHKSELAASSGAMMVGANAYQTQDAVNKERVSVRNFGAVGDGVTDDTAAIQAAINAVQDLGTGPRSLRINSTGAGVYKVTAPLVVSANFLTVEWDSTNAIIKKFFNGEVFHINGGEVEFHRCAIDGNGATYTGGGIRLLTNAANSFRLINPRIKETASAPVLIEPNGGSLMKVIGGMLQPFGANAAGPTHAIAMTGPDTGPANRKMIGVSTGGAPIFDASGAETVQIIGCDGSKITTSSTSKKVSATGNRMQTAGANNPISGVDHCFVGNTVASSFELAAGASNCVVKENVTVGAEVIDGSGNTTNKVAIFSSNYTPVWGAATTNPVLGNGTLSGTFDRHDKQVTATVDLTMGSTTTYGVGAYTFSMPLSAAAGRTFTGSAWLLDNGTAFYVGTVLVTGGGLSAQVYFNATAGAMSATVPITLAAGDRLRFEVTYTT